jgi:hypothetical protein
MPGSLRLYAGEIRTLLDTLSLQSRYKRVANRDAVPTNGPEGSERRPVAFYFLAVLAVLAALALLGLVYFLVRRWH